MDCIEIVECGAFMTGYFHNTNKEKITEELKTARHVMEYQKALLLSFEAKEITAEHLRAATYAARMLLKTMNDVAEAEHPMALWGT